MSESSKKNQVETETTATIVISKEQYEDAILEGADDSSGEFGSLILIHGNPQGKRFNVDRELLSVGRIEECNIQLNENGVSRKHSEISVVDGVVQVKDLGSTNGTFVNDVKIETVTVLNKDDLVGIGTAVLKYLPPGSVELKYHRRLQDAAYTDPLTGVNNKGYLMEALEMEFKSHGEKNLPLAIVVIDLDHFKNVNDTFGHDCGDYVLKQASKQIREEGIRNSDIIGRYGGEEFVVILPETDKVQAVEIAERIRNCIGNHEFIYEEKVVRVTASCGVAHLSPKVKNHIALFKLADRAVYQAKNSGRNKVCFAVEK